MKLSMKRTLSLALTLVIVLSLFALPMQVHAATLKPGSKGTQVKYLQMNLKGLGFLTDKADGDYGPKTAKAVRLFQHHFGLHVDGIAGNETLSKIRKEVKIIQKNLIGLAYLPSGSDDGIYGTNTTKAVEKYQRAYRLGANGIADIKTRTSIKTRVIALQKNLIGLGYLRPGSADGDYGPNTKAAVRNYQQDHGLSADGIAGYKTQDAICNTIKHIQELLIILDYLPDRDGIINGVYDQTTMNAVEAFQDHRQETHGLEVDGIAGPLTRAAFKDIFQYIMYG